MSASTNFNFPPHPTSRSHAMQIVEGTRALQQSPLAMSSAFSTSKYNSNSYSPSASKKTNYAESTTSSSSFSSRTGLLKEKLRSSFGSSSPSSDNNKSNKSMSRPSSTSSQTGQSSKTGRTKQDSLLLLGSQIRMGH